MTQPEASPPDPEDVTTPSAAGDEVSTAKTPDTEAEAEAEPPQPWTPERVSEWNAYYDVYVFLAVLLLTFVVASVRINSSNFWTHLKTGELIAAQTAPIVSDPFTYTVPGARWVNIPWLFQWSHAAAYKFVNDLVPTDQADPTANRGAAEQIAVGTLIALNALARLLTAWILMKIRRPGPGLWWSAVCAAISLGAILGPFGVVLGGLAGPGFVGPMTWGLLLMAIEMLLLHKAYNEGRRQALYGLVPLFLLWANVDESFFTGLLVLAAAVIGRILDGQMAEMLIEPASSADSPPDQALAKSSVEPHVRPVGLMAGLVTLLICAAVSLVNPSAHRVFFAVLNPFFQLFGPASDFITFDQLSYFGKGIRQQAPADWYWWTVSYLLMVALGLASFLLNARRFSWSRFLPFALLAAWWGVFVRFGPEFAVVFAPILALNGQEWYQDRFGTRGKLGAGWTLWSTGGRLVTLFGIFFFVAVAITGVWKGPEEPRFGFGFDPNDFPFEAAEFLARREDIKGNILNTTLAQGDAMIWRAYPSRKTFLDGRSNLFPRELLDEHHRLRTALVADEVEAWKPELDKYGISAVMIDSAGAPRTYFRLMQSPNWIPIYDDGRVVMFGRSDAAEPDLTAFKNNRLEPEMRAYKVAQPVPAADRPPTPTSWIDDIFRNRLLGRPQSHTNAAGRWLQGVNIDRDQPNLPDPARCLLAIREARTALSKNPDDWLAYRLLDAGYRYLTLQETAILGGLPLTPENQVRISNLTPNIEILNTRFKQLVTALSYAIATTPPPKSPEARRELQSLNIELYTLYLQAGFLDLARDRLQLAVDSSDPSDFQPQQKAQYQQMLDQLNQRVKQVEEGMMDLQVERQAGPIEKAAYARGQGAPGLAMTELEEADRGNISPVVVKPQLIDLYCNTGQPDKALELISMASSEDPNLGTEPGMSFMRQGQVFELLGNYLSAASLWRERAIPRLRYDRSMRALSAAQVAGKGELIPAVNTDEMIPALLTRQGYWEFELGLCYLESGAPDRAAEHFTKALEIVPEIGTRPLIAYYLGKMGRPVPALPATAESTLARPGRAVDQLLQSGVSGTPVPAPIPKPQEVKKKL
jgi:tetratricopeptide (TPR) repeat protein